MPIMISKIDIRQTQLMQPMEAGTSKDTSPASMMKTENKKINKSNSWRLQLARSSSERKNRNKQKTLHEAEKGTKDKRQQRMGKKRERKSKKGTQAVPSNSLLSQKEGYGASISRKAVSFNSCVNCKNILHHREFTREEHQEYWYTPQEYILMRQQIQFVVQQYDIQTKSLELQRRRRQKWPVEEGQHQSSTMSPNLIVSHSASLDIRGLEGKTRNGRTSKRDTIDAAKFAVLETQYLESMTLLGRDETLRRNMKRCNKISFLPRQPQRPVESDTVQGTFRIEPAVWDLLMVAIARSYARKTNVNCELAHQMALIDEQVAQNIHAAKEQPRDSTIAERNDGEESLATLPLESIVNAAVAKKVIKLLREMKLSRARLKNARL